MILPDRVFGSLSLNSISRGAAWADSPSFTNRAMSAFSSSEGSYPSKSEMNALIISPLVGSGFPITPASATAGCSSSLLSTSNGPIRSPEELITSSIRPWNQKYPSSSIYAVSPEIYHPGMRKYSSYFGALFQMSRIMAGQGVRIARFPIRFGGRILPLSSMIAASMPGTGLPIEPGLIGIDG
ncbi:hypothetical protein D3C77_471010 [compost metagenome]